jgi:hypothetical protein
MQLKEAIIEVLELWKEEGIFDDGTWLGYQELENELFANCINASKKETKLALKELLAENKIIYSPLITEDLKLAGSGYFLKED